MTGSAWAVIDAADARVDAALDRLRTPALDPVMYALSSAADHSYLWHALVWLGAWRTGDGRRALRMSLVLGLESAFTNGLVKALFRRVRPREHDRDEPLPYGLRVPVTSSFPSGHATAAFTAAALLSAEHGHRLRWYSLAGLVACSRVYVRMHHASDVVAGVALGVVLGRRLPKVVHKLLG